MSVKLRLHKRYFVILLISITIIVLLHTHLPKDPPKALSQNLALKKTSHVDATKPSPVIVQPFGGLGNQLFHFAAAYSLAKKRNSDLYICLPSNWEIGTNSVYLMKFYATDRSYLLWAFNILYENIFIGNETGCTKMTNITGVNGTKFYFVNERTMLSNNMPTDHVLYVAGCFESETFFKTHANEIVRQFSPKMDVRKLLENSINDYASIMSTTESVAVHIRRGDFITENRLLPMTYYEAAIERMKMEIAKMGGTKKIKFFVFSDDIEAVKLEFRNATENLVFVSNKNLSRLADFMLMKRCKHIIIANSTFSWWAAYLNDNENKIIIAPLPKFPRDWYDRQQFDDFSMKLFGGNLSYPDTWITIDPFKS